MSLPYSCILTILILMIFSFQSGCIMAVLGAVCITYPDATLSIAFVDQLIPHSFTAKTVSSYRPRSREMMHLVVSVHRPSGTTLMPEPFDLRP